VNSGGVHLDKDRKPYAIAGAGAANLATGGGELFRKLTEALGE
jgi:hypothetical protein